MKKYLGCLLFLLISIYTAGCYDDTKNTGILPVSDEAGSYSGIIMVKLKDESILTANKMAPLSMKTASVEPLMKGHKVLSIKRLSMDQDIEGFKKRAKRAGLISDGDLEKRVLSKKRLHLIQVEDLTSETAEEICKEFRKDPRVEYAEPDRPIRLFETMPDDYHFMSGEQWPLYNIDMDMAWDYTTGSADVTVAVIDSGVDYTHPDLAGNCIAGYDFWNNDSDPMDDYYHGTHVAGIIGAVGNNHTGISGTAWTVRIMPLKVFPPSGGTLNAWVSSSIQAINFAVANGADIINASYGWSTFSQSEREAIMDARDAGVLFVAAAGNGQFYGDGNGDNNDVDPTYPACYNLDNIISVAASTWGDNIANYSNYGVNTVDLAAPGGLPGVDEVYSTLPVNMTEAMTQNGLPVNYGELSGTSMAAPHVAGVAALIKSLRPGYSYADIKKCILNGAEPLSILSGKVLTGGKLNGYNSLRYASTYSPPAPSQITFTLPANGIYYTPIQWLGLGVSPLSLNFTVQSVYPIASATNAKLVSGNNYNVTLSNFIVGGPNIHDLVVSFIDNRGYIKEFTIHYTVDLEWGYLFFHYVYRLKYTYSFIQ
ncbi:MAG TPA: S8 family peptidase [Spirochaetota bacterium]|nr:S8 family peptidase [Spirochaetota bacterium]HPV43617.1 S8 family peptidase [Spirochaetota bacterium]